MQQVIAHSKNVTMNPVERGENLSIQWLIGEEHTVNFYMRRFTFGADGTMPLHKHENLYHEEYFLQGKLKMRIGEKEYTVQEGAFLLIPQGKPHSYENVGEEYAQFLCVIPAVEDVQTEILEET